MRRMTLSPDDVRAKLKRLEELDPRHRTLFGAMLHHYRLAPVVDEVTVADFEAQHGVALPPDYRHFLTAVGNGGAGPYYGVFALGEEDAAYGNAPWKPGVLVGDLSRPFPYHEAWNLPADDIAAIQAAEEDDHPLLLSYWGPRDGAIPVCHEGCALRDWLVVSGPEAGHMWHDATADMEGWRPITDASGGRVTFGAWYRAWLEKALLELEPV
jgi:hypothetical protein